MGEARPHSSPFDEEAWEMLCVSMIGLVSTLMGLVLDLIVGMMSKNVQKETRCKVDYSSISAGKC